jgi:hypothetical protein
VTESNLPVPAPARLPAPVEPATPMTSGQRWRLIRDLTVFQIKLLIDGLKDLVLGPLSLVAGIVDLARGTPPATGLFHGLLRAGAQFDRWVGLFDTIEPPEHAKALTSSSSAAPEQPVEVAREPSLDEHLRRLEQLLIAQQRGGGLTADAQQAVDRAINLLEARFKN